LRTAQPPVDLEALRLLGATHSAKGEDAQAEDALGRYLVERPDDVGARKLLAATRLRLDEPAKALLALTPVEAQAEQDADLLLLFARAAARDRQFERAVRDFRQATEARPDDMGIRADLAAALIDAGDYQGAIEELGELPNDDRRRLPLLTRAYLRKGDLSAARAAVQGLLEQSPNAPEATLLAAEIELAADDPAAAGRFLREAASADHRPAMNALGRMKLQGGELEEAERWFNRALGQSADDVDALMGLAGVAAARGDADAALERAQRAQQVSAGALAPRLLLGRLYLDQQKTEEAIEVLEEAQARRPNSKLLALLGEAYKKAGNAERSLTIYRELLKQAPDSPPVLVQMATLESDLGRHAAAKRHLERALELDPSSAPARAALALVAAWTGRPDQGLSLAKEIQRREPDSPLGYTVAGDIQAAQGDDAAALDSYREAAKRQSSRDLVIKQHRMLTRIEDDAAVRAQLTGWLAAHPQDTDIRLLLAIHYQTTGRHADAIREYEQILGERPDDAVAMNNLAPLVFAQDPEQGLGYASRALELAPDNPAIRDTYGWLLVESGRPEEGIGHLRQAAAALDHPSIRYHLAVAMAATGSMQAAQRELTAALDSEQSFAERQAAQSLLDDLQANQGGAAAER